MKNKTWILLIFLLILLIGVGVYFSVTSRKESNESNYESNRTSTAQNNEENKQKAENIENESETNNQQEQAPQYIEEQLSTFSTKIYSNDSARQNNIKITCNTLNDTIVKDGATFSFCNTVGKATAEKGYLEADVYDHNGNKTKGLGGGNCQVSSTLYNAILAVSSLKITERHAHSNYVPYVPKGKDAAVSYGSYDLKFLNNTGNDIKIKASTDNSNVTISINSLKQV